MATGINDVSAAKLSGRASSSAVFWGLAHLLFNILTCICRLPSSLSRALSLSRARGALSLPLPLPLPLPLLLPPSASPISRALSSPCIMPMAASFLSCSPSRTPPQMSVSRPSLPPEGSQCCLYQQVSFAVNKCHRTVYNAAVCTTSAKIERLGVSIGGIYDTWAQ